MPHFGGVAAALTKSNGTAPLGMGTSLGDLSRDVPAKEYAVEMLLRERVGDFGRRSRAISNALLFGACSQPLVQFLLIAKLLFFLRLCDSYRWAINSFLHLFDGVFFAVVLYDRAKPPNFSRCCETATFLK